MPTSDIFNIGIGFPTCAASLSDAITTTTTTGGTITTTGNPYWGPNTAQSTLMSEPEPGTLDYVVYLMQCNMHQINKALFMSELNKFYCNEEGHDLENNRCRRCKEHVSKLVVKELKR